MTNSERIKESVLRVASQTVGHQAYRGYLIHWSIFTLDKPDNRVWVERDGFHICWANTVDQAKAEIDELLDEPVMVCSWCPDADSKTASAQAAGRVVTHGICKPCSEGVV